MIVIGERALEYVAHKLDYRPHHDATAIGIERNGRVVAGAVFSCFTGADIDITIAAEPGGITRGFMRAVAHYVFEQAGCVRASFMTEQDKVVTVTRRFGAIIEGVKRNAYGPGRDGVMLGLLKQEWLAFENPRSSPAP